MHTTLKAGKYYIGDPCYPFDKSWDKILDDTNFFKNEYQCINGIQVVVGETAYGDGLYTDNHGREYTVDAGMIGVLPIELIEIDNEYTIEEIEKSKVMHIVEFSTDFDVEIHNGRFIIGDIFINTAPSNEEENYNNLLAEDEYSNDWEE